MLAVTTARQARAMSESVRHLRSGDGHGGTAVAFELRSPGVPFAVSVRLSAVRDRWVAVATVDDREMTGIGASPRAALQASLSPLGARTVALLMADTSLVAVSLQLPG